MEHSQQQIHIHFILFWLRGKRVGSKKVIKIQVVIVIIMSFLILMPDVPDMLGAWG